MPSIIPRGALAAAVCAALGPLAASDLTIPAGPNSWVFDQAGTCIPSRITANDGIKGWSDARERIRTFFWIGAPATVELRLALTVAAGSSHLRASLDAQTREVTASAASPGMVALGSFALERPGYHFLELAGVSREAATFAEITALEISGGAAEIHYLKDDFHFGRRGPSVHLNYRLPKEARDLRCFYNEVSVPVGQDAIGTYCMANGFGEGYSGLQVNSAQERRILFSVWSPFSTNDPKQIPEADRVVLLRKGPEVVAQAFGGEGSGGQSFLRYPWQAGATYRFLLVGEPTGDGSTVFTAYFAPPLPGTWRLLASFRRPKTSTYLTHWHSFLENFSPDTGAITREGNYANQWACDKSGRWWEVTEASFSADATARKQARLDYTGGVTAQGRFFLRNCGFANDRLAMGTALARPPRAEAPQIDIAALPQE